MNANQFRIGNLILAEHCDGSLHVEEIAELAKKDGWEKAKTKRGWHFKEPIPLTEEWLVKFGFISIQDGWYQIEKMPISFNWNIYDNTLRFMGYSFKHIKYVHQLQNLYFALTGEELQIND